MTISSIGMTGSYPLVTLAQITGDGTVGTQVNGLSEISCVGVCRINGGTARGVNLFHSFQEFSVPTLSEAWFDNGAQVQNILTRVTGNTVSSIDGLIKTNGNANLFFLNPNGIEFGANARLQIGGSFLASTASRFKFADGSEFSAIDPQVAPLLVVNLTPGLQTGESIRPGTSIVNRGNLTVGEDLTLVADRLDLQGQLKAGRDLTLQGNQGIDIFALDQAGLQSGRNLSLISDGVISGDTHFASGGAFQVRSRSGQLGNFSSLYDPIISSTGDVDIAAGYTGASLLIESQGNVRVRGPVTINAADTVSSFVGSDAILSAKPGLIIRTGQPNLVYGNINQNNPPAFADRAVPAGITLDRPTRVIPVKLTADNGGITFHSIDASNRNGENGGDIEVTANKDITNTGAFYVPVLDNYPIALGVTSYADNGNSLNGGNITLTSFTGAIKLQDGASDTSSFSRIGTSGNGGNILYFASNGDLLLKKSELESNSFSTKSSGNGGSIFLYAANGNLSLINSNVLSSTNGNGNGGNISFYIANGNLSLTNSRLSSASNSSNGGNISFYVANGNLSFTNSNVFSSGGLGNGGNISFYVDNGNLSLFDSSSSSGSSLGNGGNISFYVNYGNLSLFNSSLNTSTLRFSLKGDLGNAGAISFYVNNGNLSLQGAMPGGININSESYTLDLLRSGRSASGNGGDISFHINNGNLSIEGIGLKSSSDSLTGDAGNGGDIFFYVNNGNLSLRQSELSSYSNSNLDGATNGGAISFYVNKGDISLHESSLYSGRTGNGGAISLSAKDGNILGNSAFLNTYTISNSGLPGNGGVVKLTSKNNVSGLIITTLSTGGRSGDVEVIGSGDLRLSNNRIITAQQLKIQECPFCTPKIINVSDRGQAGKVSIASQGNLTLNNNMIQSDTRTNNTAGDITITSPGLITFNNTQISSDTSNSGKAGEITITGNGLTLNPGSTISTNTLSTGQAGNILLTLNDRVTLSGQKTGLFSITTPKSSGNGGNIIIDPSIVILQDGAKIAVDSQGSGVGGSIRLQSDQLILRDRASITANSASAQGGNITLNTKDVLLLQRNSLISATAGTTQTGGDGGNVTINAPQGFLVGIPAENSDITANAYSGKGGRVDISSQGVFGLQVRPRLTPFSDITASSESGPTGIVAITPPNVDPNRGLVPLPVSTTDPSNKIDQQCAAETSVSNSQFTVKGNSGLPASPSDRSTSATVITRLATVPSSPNNLPKALANLPLPHITEAQTAIRLSNGRIRFASDTTTVNLSVPNCRLNQ
jgi:filamentous hemagglutinin family protein